MAFVLIRNNKFAYDTGENHFKILLYYIKRVISSVC